jgi:signal transduction histidine kinase
LEDKDVNIARLLAEIEVLKSQLFDANNIIDAIREGTVDALVLHNDGVPQVYSLETADYTYRILIEKFSEGALSITADGLILYCNDYFSKLVGIPPGNIAGTYLKTYFDAPEEFALLAAALKDGASKAEIVLSLPGRKLPVDIAFTDLHPTVEAIGVVITDLSEKKKHEQALIKHQHDLEMKVEELNATNINLEQFIHVISHDLKEPLRKILMYTSRLNGNGFPQNEKNPVEVVKASALRLNSLVDDLVKYAMSAIKDEAAAINLDEVVKEVLEDLELVLQEKGAMVRFDALPRIVASKVQMRQLFANLITNAVKYGKKGIQPQISITHQFTPRRDNEKNGQQQLKISIADNGIGMDKAHLSKIFTIFQRLHHRNEYSGNGIGLAICKKIMENHSGRIEVESSPAGSVFNLYFPTDNA